MLFRSPQAEARLKALAVELRCLVCQNQTLADSNAPLAEDLRREVREMIAKDMSDKEIIDFLVTRYGDFVLYRPTARLNRPMSGSDRPGSEALRRALSGVPRLVDSQRADSLHTPPQQSLE